jgi:hypothetical protein
MVLTTRSVVSMCSVAMMLLGADVASGQNPSTELRTGYPNKVIRMYSTEAGGNLDLWTRAIVVHASVGVKTVKELISWLRPILEFLTSPRQPVPAGNPIRGRNCSRPWPAVSISCASRTRLIPRP